MTSTIKPTSSEFMTPIASEHPQVCQPQSQQAADGYGQGHESEGDDFELEDDDSEDKEDEDEEDLEYSYLPRGKQTLGTSGSQSAAKKGSGVRPSKDTKKGDDKKEEEKKKKKTDGKK